MENSVFYDFVFETARRTFGTQVFARRALMNAVVDRLKDEDQWLDWYNGPSSSRGVKTKGMEKVDYAFLSLKLDGRLVHHDRNQWRVAEDLPDIDQDCIEGGKKMYTHLKIERRSDLIRRKKEDVLKRFGKLACEVCTFDFHETYGHLGEGFAECHHLVPLSFRDGIPLKTKQADLAILCSNCHRMVHHHLRRHPALNGLAEIKKALKKASLNTIEPVPPCLALGNPKETPARP